MNLNGMRKIRTIIVDDEPLARARVEKLLDQLPYIQLVSSCKNGKEAWEKITDYRPDLILLDVQMPYFNGFEVLEKLEANPMPFVIFITAFDQYALKAFDIHAIDYLLKPYDDDRFFSALEFARKQIELKQKAFLHEKMVQMIDQYQVEEPVEENTIRIKDKDRVILVDQQDVIYVASFGNYVKIHTKNKIHLYRQTMQTLAENLDKRFFLRIHRSLIVNSNFIEVPKYLGNNQYVFHLTNGRELISSRSYKSDIQTFLEELELKRKIH